MLVRRDAVIHLVRDETGASAIEYGLIAMLVSVALMAALWVLGGTVSEMYLTDTDAINRVVATID